MSETAEMLFFYLDKYGRGEWRENWWRIELEQFNQERNRPITKYIEKGSKVLSTLEPFSIYILS